MDEQPNFTASIAIRCTEELRGKLERLAARDQRSLAQYVRVVLENHARKWEGRDVPSKKSKAA